MSLDFLLVFGRVFEVASEESLSGFANFPVSLNFSLVANFFNFSKSIVSEWLSSFWDEIILESFSLIFSVSLKIIEGAKAGSLSSSLDFFEYFDITNFPPLPEPKRKEVWFEDTNPSGRSKVGLKGSITLLEFMDLSQRADVPLFLFLPEGLVSRISAGLTVREGTGATPLVTTSLIE